MYPRQEPYALTSARTDPCGGSGDHCPYRDRPTESRIHWEEMYAPPAVLYGNGSGNGWLTTHTSRLAGLRQHHSKQHAMRSGHENQEDVYIACFMGSFPNGRCRVHDGGLAGRKGVRGAGSSHKMVVLWLTVCGHFWPSQGGHHVGEILLCTQNPRSSALRSQWAVHRRLC